MIMRVPGQGLLNAQHHEAAPTWEVGATQGKVVFCHDGQDLMVGQRPVTIGSHMPLKWLLRFAPESWDIHMPDSFIQTQLRVDAPEFPPGW
jgi:hypothetical protein